MQTLENYSVVTENIMDILTQTQKSDFGSFILRNVEAVLSNNLSFNILSNVDDETLNVFETFNDDEKAELANQFLQIIKNSFLQKIGTEINETLFSDY